MSFIHQVFEKLKRHPKRIVFPEGHDARVIRAAQMFYEGGLGIPILLGKKDEIQALAEKENASLSHVRIIDPEKSPESPAFCQRLERLDRYKNIGVTDSRDLMVKPHYFASMMVQYAQADAVVGGINSFSGVMLRPLNQLIKPLPHSEVLSACAVVEFDNKSLGDDGVLFFADAGIVPDPTMQQLASIAIQTGIFARQVFGQRPRIAMLSFSSKGSARTPSTEKVAGATILARQIASSMGADMAIDGEMQADAALDPLIAERKMGASLVGGRANVLIFPDLNSGNIALKLLNYCASVRTFGQLILGLSKPAAELSRGADESNILAMAALAGLQAVEYRKLHPADDE